MGIGRAFRGSGWSVLVLLGGLVLTIWAASLVRQLENQRLAFDFKVAASDRVAAVRHQFEEQKKLLESVAALWSAVEEIDRVAFRGFVERLIQHGPRLKAIGYAPRVEAGGRAAFERAARTQGLAGFRITEADTEGRMVAAQPRSDYYPVFYLEPVSDNEAALGFDLASHSVRREALERARDSGRIQASRRIHLVQDREDRVRILMAAPIYRRDANTDDVTSRRANLVGFATQVFWIDEVIESGLAQLMPGGVDLDLLDPSEPVTNRIVYRHLSQTRSPEAAPAEGVSGRGAGAAALLWPGLAREFEFGGRRWILESRPSPEFLKAHRGPLPGVALAAGLLLTVGLTSYLASMVKRSKEIREANAALEAEVEERLRSESELRLGEERFRGVIENMPVLMMAFDEQWNVIAWNRECQRVSGYSANEIEHNPAAIDLLSAPEARGTLIEEWRARTQDSDREWQLRSRDGEVHTISWSNISDDFPVPGWHSWGVGVDVTRRKQAEAEREDLQRQMLQTQKLESLGILAGGIAHDFNNLLTSILGNTAEALRELSETSQVRPFLAQIQLASERAAMLTRQMLAYTGRGSFERQPVDLSEHVREIAGLLSTAVTRKTTLRLDLAEGLPAVEADPSALQQLVMNLAINAAESSGDGPGVVEIRSGIAEFGPGESRGLVVAVDLAPGEYVTLEVEDTGMGMSEATVARIFDPFFTTKFTGRGLGLAAVLGIVRSHRGGIAVDTQPGHGSTFRIYLPASAHATQQPIAVEAHDDPGQGLVLLVDDEAMIRSMARRGLERRGYRVYCAEGGAEALRIFANCADEIDCVVLDMTMPEMDGAATLGALRKIRGDVPVLLMSGYSEAETLDRFVEPIAGFIPKPFTAATLAAAVARVLKSKDHH
ncbi:MAG: response regulator [bacterium]|nr:response regulator [bacterium]